MPHTLPDVLEPNLNIVFCGTAAGDVSRFWKTLSDVGLTLGTTLEPSDYSSALQFRIGFTDLAKHTSGQDASLKTADFDVESLREKIERYAPTVLAFNGKKAASVFLGVKSPNYGLHEETIGSTAIFVLPSTSAAAKKFWDIRYWRDLASFVRSHPETL